MSKKKPYEPPAIISEGSLEDLEKLLDKSGKPLIDIDTLDTIDKNRTDRI